MKQFFLFIFIFVLTKICAFGQIDLRFVVGQQDTVNVAHHLFRGMTLPSSHLTVNGVAFPVYRTGAFAAEVRLAEGSNTVKFVVRKGNEETTRDLVIFYAPRPPQRATSRFEIESIDLIPNVSMVSPGDVLRVRVKTLPAVYVSWLGGKALEELPITETAGIAGIYQALYIVKENDTLFNAPVTISVNDGRGQIERTIRQITVLDPSKPLYVRTKTNSYLNYGLGQDRLGGSKIGYIQAGINLRVVGKVGALYKVQLSKRRTAWIPENEVEVPRNEVFFRPDALTSSWSVFGDENFDYVRIGVSDRLPYSSFQEINPNRIVVDIYGVATNTAWITQLFTTKTINNVDYQQIEDDILRIYIDLNTKRHWGYSVYYEGNQMVIRLRHQPTLRLKGLRIALDAGHGGSSTGAVGTTGMQEKVLNLELVMMLKRELEKQGAHVILTRTDDTDVGMRRRLDFLQEQMPDILVSVHNNAGGNPLTTTGVSTYYRHIGYHDLSAAILRRMLQLDVKNFGNVGSFNFALSSPTEYPNVLIEGLFMSTPEDEAKLADDKFKAKLVKKIVAGLKDYLKDSR
jgi:N-acetylmuramoyl-L-alanine amidase